MIASAFAAASLHRRPGNEAGPRSRIAGLNRDVLRDRHPFDEPEILVDEGDRQRIRSRMDRLAGEQDLAGVGFVDPGQYFDQRRFARAVLSQKRVDLAAADVEIDVIERERPGEALDEPGHRQQRRRLALRTGWSTGSTIDHSGFRVRSIGWLDPQRVGPLGDAHKATSRPRFRDSAACSCCWG